MQIDKSRFLLRRLILICAAGLRVSLVRDWNNPLDARLMIIPPFAAPKRSLKIILSFAAGRSAEHIWPFF